MADAGPKSTSKWEHTIVEGGRAAVMAWLDGTSTEGWEPISHAVCAGEPDRYSVLLRRPFKASRVKR